MRPALFLHIQKTAGTSIVDVAAAQLGPGNMTSHGDYVGHTPAELAVKPFVSGHFGFDYAAQLIDGRYSFTFLRDPVDRVVSHYYFCRTQDPDLFVPYRLARELDIVDFVASEVTAVRWAIADNQTWQLAAGRRNAEMLGPDDFDRDDMLAAAKDHLERFDFVGFTDTADEDQLTIFDALGLMPPGRRVAANRNPSRPRDIPDELRQAIEPHVQLDLELVDHARARRNRRRRLLPRRPRAAYPDRIAVDPADAEAPRAVARVGVLHLERTGASTLVHALGRVYEPAVTGAQFSRRPAAEVAAAPLVSGHFGWDYVRRALADRFLVTVLRDPVDRIVSLYYALQGVDPEQSPIARLAQELALEAFVDDPRPPIRVRVDDYQTWQLAGGNPGEPIGRIVWDESARRLPDDATAVAMEHLRGFDHVGFTDSLATTVGEVLGRVGAPMPPIRLWLNRGLRRPPLADVPAAVRRKIEARTTLDHELVERARAEFGANATGSSPKPQPV